MIYIFQFFMQHISQEIWSFQMVHKLWGHPPLLEWQLTWKTKLSSNFGFVVFLLTFDCRWRRSSGKRNILTSGSHWLTLPRTLLGRLRALISDTTRRSDSSSYSTANHIRPTWFSGKSVSSSSSCSLYSSGLRPPSTKAPKNSRKQNDTFNRKKSIRSTLITLIMVNLDIICYNYVTLATLYFKSIKRHTNFLIYNSSTAGQNDSLQRLLHTFTCTLSKYTRTCLCLKIATCFYYIINNFRKQMRRMICLLVKGVSQNLSP